MHFHALISICALIGLVVAHPFSGPGRCSSGPPSQPNSAATRLLIEEARLNPENSTRAIQDTLSLNVYFHVVSDGNSSVPDHALRAQLAVINSDYAPAGISFTLIKVTHTVNRKWSRAARASTEEREMKAALRQGTYRDLNVYIGHLVSPPGTLGWCCFPEPRPSMSDFTMDGCVVAYDSLPGGRSPYGLGKTLTHEIGHWFNLRHTFEGGCSGQGDFVDDTPAQLVPTSGCPNSTVPDTCPSPGLDPIHNYMNYSDDICMTEFTPGQITRMLQSFSRFRGKVTMNEATGAAGPWQTGS